MAYDIVKALHLIFMVTWFAGLFYIVRLFIYQAEALEKSEADKKVLIPYLKKIQRPLWYGITWPGMILTTGFGISMFFLNPALLKVWHMHLKLTLVAGLIIYHFICHRIFIQFQKENYMITPLRLRYWNEVATLFLFAIIFVMILKQNLNAWYLVAGLIILSLLIVWGVIAYKKRRSKEKINSPEDSIH
jgi:protoporphyrinogen IX oxidase